MGWGQNISVGTPYSQNFDAIGTSATASLPTGWKIENISTVRLVITAYSLVPNTATANTLVYNTAMSSTATNGSYNFGGTSATDRAVGGISSSSASKSVNMYLQLTNNGASTIGNFTISYDAERYRNGSNPAGFSIRFYYSTTGSANSWTEVSSFVKSFATNTDNTGSTTNPLETLSLSPSTLSQSLSAGSTIYFAWSYSVTTGITASNAQALGIDNITITANAIPAPTTQATNITFSSVASTTYTANWTNGNGSSRAVFVKQASSGNATPVDATTYTANAAFSSGTQIGTSGWYCVYNGTGNSVAITGLSASTDYMVHVCEYNGTAGSEVYNATSSTNNPLNQLTSAGFIAPSITTPTATSITSTSAILGGNITSDGGSAITERGTLWSTTSPVTIANNKVAEGGSATGIFTQSRTSLPSNTLVYYAAYATNSIGTTLSSEASFTTLIAEPSNHLTNFVAGSASYTTIPLTWTDATSPVLPTGYLIKGSTVSYAAIISPVDLTSEADGGLVKNIAANVQAYTFTGLLPNTAYYFKIWPYTNSGSNIDYKTDGTVPQQTATTLILYFRSHASGNWNAPATWDVSTDNSNWTAASTEIPLYINSDVTISSGHAVTIPTSYNSGTAKNLTVESGGTLYANAATGTCFVNIYGDFLNNGTVGGSTDVIGFDIEGSNCLISGTGTFIVNRISKYTLTNPTTNLTIGQNITLQYSLASAALVGKSGAVFNIIVNPGVHLSVSSAKIDLSYGSLTLKSNANGTASLLDNGTILGMSGTNVTVERYITGWSDATHGWHLLSSPVAAQTIDPAFIDATATNYDFYKWDEASNTWLNQKELANSITSFAPGTGYLVAYSATSAKQFSGMLNVANVSVSGLTKSSGANQGWHLLGNPFPSALTWGTAAWSLTNMTTTAKIWQETTAAYVDIASTTGIIPAMNGFMVETSGTGSLTIPIAARVHNTAAWYKSSQGQLKLLARDTEGNTAQESIIKVADAATEGFDSQFDSHFLAGYAPTFYSAAASEQLSTNTLPVIDNSRLIPMGFVKNTSGSYSIELAENSLNEVKTIYLTDKKTGIITELTKTPVYTFTASEGDDASRFLLSFATTHGIPETTVSGIQVYTNGSLLIVTQQDAQKGTVMLYNVTGQLLRTLSLSASSSQTLSVPDLAPGVYVVSIRTGKGLYNQKVIVNQ